MSTWPTCELLGMRLARIDTEALLEHVFAALAAGRGGWIVTANVDFLQRYARDAEVRALYDAADIRVADGMPLIWASRIVGHRLPERIAGASLTGFFAARAAREGRSLYLLGGAEDVNARAVTELAARHLTLAVRGASPRLSSPPTPAELGPLQAELERVRPDLVLVALGTPKQEQVIAKLRGALPGAWMMGVGGSLDFLAGRVARAPGWMQKSGLEWAHRLAQEPRRLARRYLVDDLPFTVRLLFEAARARGAARMTAPIAYLTNQYPAISHTFIRREILALERLGLTIHRYSARRSRFGLVDPLDEEEARRTTVLLDEGAAGFAAGLARTAAVAPARFAAAARLAQRLGRRSDRGALRHGAYLAEACVLREAVRAQGVGLVHAHFGTNSATVAMLCHELGGPPWSFTVHGPEIDDAYVWSLGEKLERAAFVIAISHHARSQLLRLCGRAHWSRIHVVRCGIDAALLEDAVAPLPAAPRLVAVGRLAPEKGYTLLVDALARLHREGRDFQVHVIGDGELRADLERTIAEEGLGAKITLLGWGDGATVLREIDGARGLVMSSLSEGLPVVIMEALARGRPVIAPYIAGIPELVEDGRNGWLVPAGSPEDLARALRELLDAPLARLADLGQAGRVRVGEQHRIEPIAGELAAIIQRAAVPSDARRA